MNPADTADLGAWADPGTWAMLGPGDATTLLLWLTGASIRTLAAMIMLPVLSSALVTGPVRVALALAATVPVVAGQMAQLGLDGQYQPAWLPTDFSALPILMLFLREAAIGIVVGLGYGALCAGLLAVGEIIDHQTGLTFTQNIDAAHGNTISVTAKLIEHVLFAVLMQAGIVLLLVDTLYLSYEVWPMGQALPALQTQLPLVLIRESSRLFSLALLLAGPVVLVLFVVDAGAGMLNRAAPQFNVFMLSLSLKSIVGIAVLAAAMPMIIERSVIALLDLTATLRMFIR
ncbi:MAG: flagellar biosynthetic protein FliR [Rubrivivax sp.]|nr:flagellar biosynthetic protein FliR [Rubrivivax sp.]